MSWRVHFVLLAATWGSSFLFIKVLGERWPALWVAFGRVSLGALTLIVLTLTRGERLRFEGKHAWWQLLIAALLFNAIPFSLFAYGEKHVSSIVAGLWNATTPLWVLIAVLVAFEEEQPDRARIAGLLVGFLGVAIVLGPWRGLGHGELIGHLACAAAALCYGLGFPFTRRYLASRPESGVVLSAGQLLWATVLLAVVLPFTASPTTHIGLKGIGSVLALGVLGSGVAYALNYSIVRAAGAAVASTVTYLVPVFSTMLGVLVLHEPLSWNEPLGAIVLITGIALSQGRIRAGGVPGAAETRGNPAAPAAPVAAPAGGSAAQPRSRHRSGTRRDNAG